MFTEAICLPRIDSPHACAKATTTNLEHLKQVPTIEQSDCLQTQCESWLSVRLSGCPAIARHQTVSVPVATASATSLSDQLTDGLEQVGACLSTSTKRRNAMTSDGNLNMQGQHSGNGAAGSHSNIEERKQRGGGDVKTLWKGSRTGGGG